MQRQKRLSVEFTRKLAEFTVGALSVQQFDKLIALIEQEIKLHYFTSASESNLLRIFENQFDKIFFLKECLTYPQKIEVLVTLSSNSNYLSDILVRNPEYFFLITNTNKIKIPLTESDYELLVAETANRFKTFQSRVNALRNLKRRELLRIGIADIYLGENLERITTELTFLAKSITRVLFELCYREVLSKYKIEKLSNKYCLIALGKLGGEELNYSSDIDLIAFTDKNTFINKKIYYNQLITETIQLFIEQASSVTPNGFLYRVDFRLRPDGRNAPLCGSINQYLHYYEMRGEDWERQMLIKSGFNCGNTNLFKKFTSFIEKFIYPSSFRVSPLVQIKKLKSSVEKLRSDELNIKLLPGGIRDIEFSVQALQLLNGGKMPVIRSANTLNSIRLLSEKNLLSKKESQILSESYIFFRKIEHYLQLMNNAQTHTIPDSGEMQHKLGIYLGFNTTAGFRKALADHRARVSEVYKSITVDNNDTEQAFSEEIIFSDVKRATDNLEFLQYGKGILAAKKFDALTTSLYESIRSELFRYLKNSSAPDQILENFTRIIKSAQFPGIWYKEFADLNYFRLFLKLCENSQYAINLFAEDKYLRDLFLSRKCLEKIVRNSFQNFSTKEILFILSVQYTSGLIDLKFVNSVIFDFISDKIKSLSYIFSDKKKWKDDFLIIAMGSLGAKEITFSSDIDLIFTVKNINKYPRIQKEFQEILSELKNYLSPFEVDCRLRPEGKNSYLIWDLDTYFEYLRSRARVWEIQAFLKANFIAGSNAHYNNLVNVLIERIKTLDAQFIKNEFAAMRKKIISNTGSAGSLNVKSSPGGLTDMELITAYYVLTDHKIAEQSTGFGTENSAKILSLQKQIKTDFKTIADNFAQMKNVLLANTNMFDIRSGRIAGDELKLKRLSFFLSYKNSDSFLKECNTIMQYNLEILKEVLS